ncbi:MAG: SDR family oxidoreductase [candidate division Zixibacteria bacterium]|nr:SDR family oxidoreductase [candidate division Zixibacteria bacterium]
MDLQLKGKRALVTGASAGLGAAAALALAKEGVDVTINARGEEKLEKTANMILGETAVKPVLAPGDVARENDIDRILETAADVDILVVNSGGPPPGQFIDLALSQWGEAHRLLLASAIRLTRGVIDGMLERKWGRLIYITSIAVLQPVNDLILSNTYRAGVTGLCKTISNNYAVHGLTANCVCPGYTATERLQSLAQKRAEAASTTAEAELAAFAADVPAGRLGRPEELAALITFLASDRAAYITGVSIPVDGGLMRALI